MNASIRISSFLRDFKSRVGPACSLPGSEKEKQITEKQIQHPTCHGPAPPPAVGAWDVPPGISVLTQELLGQTSLLLHSH